MVGREGAAVMVETVQRVRREMVLHPLALERILHAVVVVDAAVDGVRAWGRLSYAQEPEILSSYDSSACMPCMH